MFSLKVKDRDAAKRLVAIETVRTDGLLLQAEHALKAAQPKDSTQIALERRIAEQTRGREAHDRDHQALVDEVDAQLRHAEDEREARIAAQEAEARHLRHVIRTGRTAQMEPQEAVRVRAVRDAEEQAALAAERVVALQAELAALRQQGTPTV
ncbi:hypothetical protein LWE61_11045 [Sphingobium sufflavum]|nr:hypothetical protein [Sphingobium sufflavum]